MKKLILFSTMCLAGVSAFALPDYDPFADATGSGGTSYTAGANLIGQKNATGQTWLDAATTVTTGAQPVIASGSLTISGLASSGGNSLQLAANSGSKAARMNLGTTVNSGTIYYSFAMQLTSLTGINTSAGGSFWAGFNNSTGTQTTAPTVVSTRVETRSATGGYNIGLVKNSTSDAQFSGTTFTTSSVLFIVGSYTFNTSSGTDDLVQMWVNPSSATFGAGSAPTADLSITGVTDISGSSIASFVVFDRAGTPAAILDDLRIGTSWADVTPTVPEPGTLALGGFGIAALLFVRRFVRR